MKLKLFIPLTLLTVFSFTTKAQTKEETEKWIVEKINKLMSKKTIHELQKLFNPTNVWRFDEEFTPIKFSIQDEKIIFVYGYARIDIKNQIPLINFIDTISSNIYHTDGALNWAWRLSGDSTNLSYWGDVSYLGIKLNCKCAQEKNSDGTKRDTDLFPIFILDNAEPDLVNRLNKAFTQLKPFYPTVKEVY